MNDNAENRDEQAGMANDADCLYCATKHMGTAYVLWCE